MSALLIVLAIVGIATCGVAIFVLVQTAQTLRSARRLFDDMDGRLVPLVEKIEVTVDAVNAELLRIDGIVTRFEDVSDAVNAPFDAVNAVGSRLRQAWTAARRARKG